MSAADYVASQPYESFIRLGRPCDRDEHGASNHYMQNLMWKERGNSAVSHLKHEKILSDIKHDMIGAVKAALKRPFSAEDKATVQGFVPRIEAADTSDELLQISQKGTEIFLKYKPEF